MGILASKTRNANKLAGVLKAQTDLRGCENWVFCADLEFFDGKARDMLQQNSNF
jgi:hypothetical protein